MKMKLIILLLLFSVNSFSQKLPINGLCWSDIKAAVGGMCLEDAFANANPAWFDATYAESGNCLMEFRNYGNTACQRPSGMQTKLYIYRTGCSGQNERYFTGSFLEASQAAWDISHSSSCVPTGWTGSQSYNYAIGDTLYHNQSGPDCSYVNDGYYLIAPYQGYPPSWTGVFSWPMDIYQIQNGMIVAKTPSDNTTIPTVYTSLNNSAFFTSFDIYGNEVISEGYLSVTSRGIAYSTSSSPTISGSHTTDGSGTGTFNSSVSRLNQGTTYFYRAYATNSKGTSYGNQETVQTASITIPVVSTNLAYFVDPSTAYFEATVNDNGGADVTSRGFCWSTSINPTIYNSISSNGSDTGFYYHTEYSLGQSMTYYVRAYATNSVGTAYGDNIPINTDFSYQ